jgi:dTDP-4-dehydrorhamnose reductase
MILLLGASGYIGQQFVKELVSRDLKFFEVHRHLMDYTQLDNIVKMIDDVQPELLINCAGYVGKPNVDVCEHNKEMTREGNVELPKNLATVCGGMGVPWIHISSGCIYTGSKENGKGFMEEDEPNFTFDNGSYYSGTKALAERLIQGIESDCYICRLRIPFDEFDGERNYLSKLMNYDKVLEATNSISHRGEFVKAALDLWQKKSPYGIYNIVNTGVVTTRQVVAKIDELLNLNRSFDFFENDKEFYKIGALAPRSNCILDNSKLLLEGIGMRNVEDALEDSLKKWKKITT